MRAAALRQTGLPAWFATLSRRERLFVAAGAGAVLLFLLYLLLLRAGGGDEPVELAAQPPPVTAAPAPLPIAPASPPALPVVAAPQPASTAGLMLQGVSGGGPGGGAALFQFPTGGQRLVRVGREVVPGMVLNSVGATHAILNSGGSELRFELNRPGAVQAIATPVAQTSGPAAASTAERQETLDLRLALQPVTSNGRVSGYALKPGTTLPRLAQAGIQPGDVITGVNGSVLDEERLMELSWAMSNSERTEFEVLRDGRKIKVALEPGSRH